MKGKYDLMRTKKEIINKCIIVFACILLNLAGRFLSENYNLPVYMDTIGTCVAAYFAGPIGGIIAGIVNNIFLKPMALSTLAYAVNGIIIALIFSFFVKKRYLKNFTSAMISGFAAGFFSVIITTPVNVIFAGGKTGNMWGDAFYDMLDWYRAPKWICALSADAIVDIVDKQLCVAIAFWIIHVILNLKSKRKNKIAALCVGLSMCLLFGNLYAVPASPVMLEEENGNLLFQGYTGTIYDVTKGMPSSEANVIEETEDGYIWIGSYAGLTRYDGKEFEFIREGGIVSVTTMMTDSIGRLWIGTNDSGLAKWENGEFEFYRTENGMPVNSVRSLAEAEDGTIYIGTTDRICKIGEDGQIYVIETSPSYVGSMVFLGDSMVGVTNAGQMFLIQNDTLQDTEEYIAENDYFTCVSVVGDEILAGTSDGIIDTVKITGNQISLTKRMESGELDTLTSIKEDREGKIWICADNGLGCIEEGKIYIHHYDGFDSSLECIHEDYEGNIWLASSRYGVLKLSESRFANLFFGSGIENTVVNAVTEYKDMYYCGTDSGLVILRKNNFERVDNELTELLKGCRIRCMIADSNDNLWLCTYSEKGLVRYENDGRITLFNKEEKDTTSDRFRCIIELSDGTIAAGTSEGINYIRGDEVVLKITEKEGLNNSQILCLIEDKNGILYAGSDGAGIYAISGGRIIRNYSTEEGLSAGVVMRMTAYKDGYFIVTSNSLCYMDGEEKIATLASFPFFNNYDVILENGTAYVLCSSGIYAVDAEKLSKDAISEFMFYNSKDGLQQGLTPNSWNYLGNDGNMYICSNAGVVRFITEESAEDTEYKFSVVSVTGDGAGVKEENGVFMVPAGVRRIVVKASLRNYSLEEVKMRFYIEGIDEEPQVISQEQLEAIQISNIAHGDYRIHLEVVNNDGSQILQQKTYLLRKEAHIWENTWYLIYMLVIAIWLVSSITFFIIVLVNISRRKKELEELRKELESKVAEQTKEIRTQADNMAKFQWSVIDSMASVIESRDGNTGAHVLNTRNYVAVIAREVLKRGLHSDIVTPEYVDYLIHVAPLHDMGKIKISDTILNKPGKFEPQEYEIMKKHSEYGNEIAEKILGSQADPRMVQLAKDVARCHHEKWDGTGYPAGLKGEEIPFGARIMAIADVFDALTAKRVYKEAMPADKAFEIIKEGSGAHFDSELVDIFLSQKAVIVALLEENRKADKGQ